MIRPTVFAIISILAHLWFGLCVVWGSLLFLSFHSALIVSYCVSGLILVKEFTFDLLFETQAESGGVVGGIEDWVEITISLGLGWLVYYLFHR